MSIEFVQEDEMAFLKVANAVVVRNLKDWEEWGGESLFHTKTAQKEIVSKYEPDKYLLTHCTIIASVDVEKDNPHFITPETTRFVNNNYDAWERDLLLGCYKTFIGANNYVEHVQVEDLAKGKVIDAVAREVIFPSKTANEREAKSIYVDILVATDRKHKKLVKDIEEERTNKLSMGCAVAFTICSKCGNKAEDTVQLCRHIKYEKGNKFLDDSGVERIVAELCGHKDDPESVKFIDASWVENPAFTGAVLNKILIPEGDSSVQAKLKSAFEVGAITGIESLHLKKVAGTNFYKVAQPEDEPEPELEEAAPEEEVAPEELAPEEEAIEEVETPDELTEISDEMTFGEVKDIIKKKLKEKAKHEIKEELLRELEEEFSESERSEEYFEEEGHTRDTLVSSSELNTVKQGIHYDEKMPFDQLGYITAKTREEAISKLSTVPRKKFADLFSKYFRSREGAEDIHTAIKILALASPNSWERLAKSKISGKGAVLLSAFLDSLIKANYDQRIYMAALNSSKFKHRDTFKAYLKRLFGRELEATELKKVVQEVERFNLFS